MPPDSSMLLLIHFLSHKGKPLMGLQWPVFRRSLRDQLLQRGILNENSSGELLLYEYTHPYIAMASLFQALEKTKQESGWKNGPVPIQIIMHQSKEKELGGLENPAASIWDLLQLETVYLTRALKLQWDQLMANKKLPSHSFQQEGNGLFELKLADRSSVRAESLFPHRSLALTGKDKECFYCGRSNHKPAACPSKHLTMETQGIPEAGYLSFQDLAANYKDAFSSPKILIEMAAGITPAQVRESRNLQAFLAYFDVFSCYQLRFLRFLAFAPCTKWHELKKSTEIEINSRNLQMGLDCLRVGQYAKAEEFLDEGRMRREGMLFYARVAQAFRCLEQGREKDFGTLLESALNLATQEKDRVYINLLLIRYYLLQGDLWKADQTSSQASTLFDQPEILYSRIQVMVRQEFGEKAFKQLHGLIKRYRRLFLTALLDPSLLPVQGVVENMLIMQNDTMAQGARDNLEEAKAACEELKIWLKPEDPVLKTDLAALGNLEKQFGKGSYFDLFDVNQKSGALTAGCQRLWSQKTEQLQAEIDTLTKRHHKFFVFWKDYPLKQLFPRFSRALSDVQKKVEDARGLLANPDGTAYRQAADWYQESDQLLTGLQALFTKMVWCKEMLRGAFVFGKKLFFSELILGLLAVLLVFVLPAFLGDTLGENLKLLLEDPWFQKQTLVVTTVLAAPILALALTFWDIKNS